MMKKILRWIIPAVLLALVLVFLDIRIAFSRDNLEHNATKATIGEGLPYAMRDPNELWLSVTGDRFLAPALERKLLAQFRSSGRFSSVNLAPADRLKMDAPFLRVEVQRRDVFYTPFYAMGQVTVETGFGSNGSVEHTFTDQPAFYSSEEGPGMHTSCEYRLQDTALGLMTYPGYASLLADQFTTRIVKDTVELYNVPLN